MCMLMSFEVIVEHIDLLCIFMQLSWQEILYPVNCIVYFQMIILKWSWVWYPCLCFRHAVVIFSFIIIPHFQVFGLFTKPLMRLLLPHNPRGTSSLLPELSSPKSFLIPLLEDSQIPEADPLCVPRPTSLRSLLTKPTRTVHYWWRRFDDAYMRPVFGGRGFVPFVPGSPTEQRSHDHSDFQWECDSCFHVRIFCSYISNKAKLQLSVLILAKKV